MESWLRRHPKLRSLVEDDDEGHTYLSAAGDLLHKVARERLAMGPRAPWPRGDPRPPQEKNHVSGVEHHRPAKWEQFVESLCAIDCVRSVRYDPQALGSRVKFLDGNGGASGYATGPRLGCYRFESRPRRGGRRRRRLLLSIFRS